VFETASGTSAVITVGLTTLRVSSEGGVIERGDLLTTSKQVGVAKKAQDSEEEVFAIALESFVKSTNGSYGLIYAEVDRERALSVLQERLKELSSSTTALRADDVTDENITEKYAPLIRGAIASVVGIGALFFVLFSFRSAIGKSIVSIGRNPKARVSIMALSFGNVFFTLILFCAIVFIALAILVLPVR
jgi:hypothetical protein